MATLTGLPLVREKSGKFKVREKSGNFEESQGNLKYPMKSGKFTIGQENFEAMNKYFSTHMAQNTSLVIE